MTIIQMEPELPGNPSDNLHKVFKEVMKSQSEEQLIAIMRQVVRQTKVSIMKHIIEKVTSEELT